MPVFPLLALFLTLFASLLVINDLYFAPLYLTDWLNLPRWAGLGVLIAIFAWLFGE